MARWRWTWIAALLVLGALTFGACGGGDDGDEHDGDEPRATEPADSGDATSEPDEDEEGGGGGGDAGAFREAAGNFIEADFIASYDALFSPEEGAPTAFTMYKKGTDKFRFDASSTVDGEVLEFILISAGAESGFCLTDAGELGALLGIPPEEGATGGVCFTDDPTGGSFDSLSDDLSDFQEDQLDGATGLPDREIAGQSTRCGTMTDADGTTSEACFTDDGVLAYLKTDDGTEFSATTISGDVSDSDFELPYEVRDFPGASPGE